jgi:hypothetical protein
MYSLYLHELFLNFFIWNIKILNIFFNFFWLIQVDPGQPGLRSTCVTQDLTPWSS